MTVSPASAANAYSAVKNLSKPQQDENALSDASGFGELVKAAVEGTLETGKVADAKAVDMLQGKANIVDVVTAVAETEVAVETLVTVRDRVISAYQEILNMPI